MRIALITPELHSLVRRTNLATVAESLANALLAAGQDVRVLIPWTRDLDTSPLGELSERIVVTVPDGTVSQRVQVLEGKLGKLTVYLLENEPFFGSRNPYGDEEGPYPDNWRRFSIFARACLEALGLLDFQPEVLHCLDWTTGLIPIYHQLDYVERRPEHPLSHAGTYFAVHNLAMQGVFEREILPHIRIPHRYFRHNEGLEAGGRVNFLKAGAEFSTVLGTHSPGHAERIQERDRGYGLEETFQRRKKELLGIHNGIDYEAWDPNSDPALPTTFNRADKDLAGKRRCKTSLQAALKLDNGPRTLLACTIGRWDADSGFDLVAEVLTELLERNIELVVMGQGSAEMGQRLSTMEGAFVGRLRVVKGYSAHTAHLMMGGADVLLLPSHYQPSNPLVAIGMRYAVVPVVYARSGLEDTVFDYRANKRSGTGFHFDPYTGDGLLDCMTEVTKTYREAERWRTLSRRCLAQDFSWKATAAEYVKAYRRVTRRVKARVESA